MKEFLKNLFAVCAVSSSSIFFINPAIALVELEQGTRYGCAGCSADSASWDGSPAANFNHDLDTRSMYADVQGTFPNIKRSFRISLFHDFRFNSCTPFPVNISINGIIYTGSIEGFGNINEGEFEIQAILRDVTNNAVVDTVPVYSQSENGDPFEGVITLINSFTDALPSSATFNDAPVQAGIDYEIELRLNVSGDGAVGAASIDVSYQDVIIENVGADQDGDGLYDLWETGGIDYDCVGGVDLDLAAMGAQPDRKDIFVEIDYMTDHLPDPVAINDVINAFDIAPVDNPVGADTGIFLHLDVDDEIPHQDDITMWGDFDTLKTQWFGSVAQRSAATSAAILGAKRLVYRYTIFAHTYNGGTSSGLAEGADDFVVTLGGSNWGEHPMTGHNVGDRRQQAGTLMHESGHTLGLGHGGPGDGDNCKPNYLSIMSYAHQTRWIRNSIDPTLLGRLDYSAAVLDPLDESALDENIGINAPSSDLARYSFDGGATILSINTSGPVDWDDDAPFPDASAVADINNFGTTGCNATAGDVLAGANDWDNLRYNFRNQASFAPGVHITAEANELTAEQAAIFENSAPVADAGSSQNVECTSHDGGLITLDGSASVDNDSTPGTNNDIVAFDWFLNFGEVDEVALGSGEEIDVALQTGSHVVTLRVTDSADASVTDTVVKTVVDTQPPTISASVSPTQLWPPNHKMRTISATVEAADVCDPNPQITLLSVTSDEPDNAKGNGDGNTVDDIQGAGLGTADFDFSVRAERAGKGDGRTYSVIYQATDASGNQAEAENAIEVPKNR